MDRPSFSGPTIVKLEREETERIAGLYADLSYHSLMPYQGQPVSFVVPKGYHTDGASIPRWIRWLIGPFEAHTSAAVAHDWLYDGHITDRATADLIFLEAMRLCGVHTWKRVLMYAAVRVGGGRGWITEHRRHERTMNPMTMGENGMALLKSSEGLRLQAYKCPEGVWTIGYGSTIDVKPGAVITATEAEARLRTDLASYERAVNQRVLVPLTQDQFDALVSWSYNVGTGWLGAGNHKPASFLKQLNKGCYDAVPGGLMLFCRGANSGSQLPGLVTRRRAEATLWRGGTPVVPAAAQSDILPQAVKPARQLSLGAVSRKWQLLDGLKGLLGFGGVAQASHLISAGPASVQPWIDQWQALAGQVGFGKSLVMIGIVAGGYLAVEAVQALMAQEYVEGSYIPSREGT